MPTNRECGTVPNLEEVRLWGVFRSRKREKDGASWGRPSSCLLLVGGSVETATLPSPTSLRPSCGVTWWEKVSESCLPVTDSARGPPFRQNSTRIEICCLRIFTTSQFVSTLWATHCCGGNGSCFPSPNPRANRHHRRYIRRTPMLHISATMSHHTPTRWDDREHFSPFFLSIFPARH